MYGLVAWESGACGGGDGAGDGGRCGGGGECRGWWNFWKGVGVWKKGEDFFKGVCKRFALQHLAKKGFVFLISDFLIKEGFRTA